MSNATLPPAGWYADSTAPGQERWWDGQGWTAHSRPQQVAHGHRSSSTVLTCPRCGSDSTKSLRAVRQQGTSTGTGTSTGWVAGDGTNPGHSVTMTTRTTSYTAAAQAAAPPSKKQNGVILVVLGIVVGAFLGWAGWWFGTSGTFGDVVVNLGLAAIIGIAIILIGIVLTPGDLAYNRDVYPGLYERWSRSWSCQRCGDVFAI